MRSGGRQAGGSGSEPPRGRSGIGAGGKIRYFDNISRNWRINSRIKQHQKRRKSRAVTFVPTGVGQIALFTVPKKIAIHHCATRPADDTGWQYAKSNKVGGVQNFIQFELSVIEARIILAISGLG